MLPADWERDREGWGGRPTNGAEVGEWPTNGAEVGSAANRDKKGNKKLKGNKRVMGNKRVKGKQQNFLKQSCQDFFFIEG